MDLVNKQDLNTLKSYFVSRVNFNESFKNIEIQVKSEKNHHLILVKIYKIRKFSKDSEKTEKIRKTG